MIPDSHVDDNQQPRLMTRSEVAELFHRKPRTISAWCRNGLLRPLRIGRSVYFSREEIEALLEANTQDNEHEYQ